MANCTFGNGHNVHVHDTHWLVCIRTTISVYFITKNCLTWNHHNIYAIKLKCVFLISFWVECADIGTLRGKGAVHTSILVSQLICTIFSGGNSKIRQTSHSYNWQLQPFYQDYELASHIAYVVSANCICKWRSYSLTSTSNYKFLRNILMASLLTLRVFAEEIFFFIFRFDAWADIRTRALPLISKHTIY